MSEIDHDNTDEIVCPYCGHWQSDSWEASDSSDCEECSECGKKFVYESETIRQFTTRKADCLNGAEHPWKKMDQPDYPDARRCPWCSKREYGKRVTT